tara:strand:- start:11747 stop:11938 length:192 start_codon:yes stop_codon:yes gene_type:complete
MRMLNATLLAKMAPVFKKVKTGSIGNVLSTPHKSIDINIPSKKKIEVVLFMRRIVSKFGFRAI